MTATTPQPIPRRAMIVAAFSTIVEWYDFTLYLYFATILSRLFFGEGSEALGKALVGFAIAYLMRPLGAMVMGHFGDRHGRRPTLLISMALMTLAMLLTALLPTRGQIGPVAGGLLLALRCLMGFSVGGEYTGVVTYLLEGAPPNRRGLVASMAAGASELGGLLAVAVCAVVVAAMDKASLDAWGWRIPFLVGSVLAGGVWLARSSMPETPDFAPPPDGVSPLRHVLRHERAGLVRSFAISALGSITYYVGITYVPAFLQAVGWRDEGRSLGLSTLAAVVVIGVTPGIGALSDRYGRKPVLLGLCLGCAVLPATMFRLMAGADGASAILGAVVLAALAGGVSAVGAVATAEQFAPRARLSGLALGATAATAIFGGAAPWLAHALLDATKIAAIPGAMIAVVAVCVAPVLMLAPETYRPDKYRDDNYRDDKADRR